MSVKLVAKEVRDGKVSAEVFFIVENGIGYLLEYKNGHPGYFCPCCTYSHSKFAKAILSARTKGEITGKIRWIDSVSADYGNDTKDFDHRYRHLGLGGDMFCAGEYKEISEMGRASLKMLWSKLHN